MPLLLCMGWFGHVHVLLSFSIRVMGARASTTSIGELIRKLIPDAHDAYMLIDVDQSSSVCSVSYI